MKTVTARMLLRQLTRRYAMAAKDQKRAGSVHDHMICGAEMQLLAGIARNDLGATFEEWEEAVAQATEEIRDL